MARSLNRVTLIGNTGADPEVRAAASGAKVANVSLATGRRIQGGRGGEERTEWHRLVFWSRLAEVVEEYVQKGDRLFVEGELRYDTYDRDGAEIPTTEIVVRELIMLGSSRRTAQVEAEAPDGLLY